MSDKRGKQGLALVTCKYHPDVPLIEEYHAGDLVCSECGIVAAERVIDVGSEWRTFSDDAALKNNSRVGQAESYLYSDDLGAVIETVKGAPKVYAQTKSKESSSVLCGDINSLSLSDIVTGSGDKKSPCTESVFEISNDKENKSEEECTILS